MFCFFRCWCSKLMLFFNAVYAALLVQSTHEITLSSFSYKWMDTHLFHLMVYLEWFFSLSSDDAFKPHDFSSIPWRYDFLLLFYFVLLLLVFCVQCVWYTVVWCGFGWGLVVAMLDIILLSAIHSSKTLCVWCVVYSYALYERLKNCACECKCIRVSIPIHIHKHIFTYKSTHLRALSAEANQQHSFARQYTHMEKEAAHTHTHLPVPYNTHHMWERANTIPLRLYCCWLRLCIRVCVCMTYFKLLTASTIATNIERRSGLNKKYQWVSALVRASAFTRTHTHTHGIKLSCPRTRTRIDKWERERASILHCSFIRTHILPFAFGRKKNSSETRVSTALCIGLDGCVVFCFIFFLL